ncbi:MAG: hypothetical protein GXY32_01245 [Ruminococcaceae bacterium]|nr:hypothetical protein [Oscillospiraceae bacterium]
MQIADVFISFLSVCALGTFLVLKCRIPAGFAPLVAMCAVPLWFALFGMVGLLGLGSWLWYLLCAGLLALALLWRRKQNNYRALLSPGSLFFVLAALATLIFLAIRQPIISQWDEFSLWGTIVKLMKGSGELYTTAEMGWAWPATQLPTLPTIGYFTQVLGDYAAWKIYAGYALLTLAVVAALMGQLSFKQYKIVVPLGVAGLLVPWFFSVGAARIFYVKPIWLNSYADIPAGMLFGGVLLLYLGLREAKGPLWPVGLALAALSMTKENTFLFALVLVLFIACDLLLFGDKPSESNVPAKGGTLRQQLSQQRLPGKLGRCFIFLLLALLPYLIWNQYIGWVVAQRQASGLSVQASEPLLQVLLNCMAMLLGFQPRTEQFQLALDNMLEAFVSPGQKITMAGTGLMTVCLILILFALAALLTADKQLRKRTFVAMGVSTLGFAGYYLELIFSYGRVFSAEQAASLESYSRYLSSYYTGWFLIALIFLGMAARKERPYGIASCGVLALAGTMLVLCNTLLPMQYNDIGYPDAHYRELRAEQAVADTVLEQLEPGDRLFFVSQRDDFGEKWFHYSYYMLPAILDFSGVPDKEGGIGGGGGTFGLPGQGGGIPSYHAYTPEELLAYITGNGCDYIFFENLDKAFIRAYKTLFSDGLAAAKRGDTMLYRVETAAGETVLTPVLD